MTLDVIHFPPTLNLIAFLVNAYPSKTGTAQVQLCPLSITRLALLPQLKLLKTGLLHVK